ncbi:hypothetical protein BC936DRAFT_137179 [Jimgerdemannia flammicorona]|uniref:Cation-transporting P-type ATPase C-terminal domain-containing protein n=1 Tax=Jimgerdemannia flammicorona TaxID=994334 RepID=A0A433CXX2_9FUNG|nr:hypothetical protein BC936DRAFT_137179 [Jimgerdemannia flammicorona]
MAHSAMKWDLVPSKDPQHLDTLIPAALNPAKTSDITPTRPPVHIVKRFEFVHARASQSVAIHDTATNRLHMFTKGSFERVRHLSAPDSLPPNYDQVSAQFAQEGCYVLSIAHRDLGVVGTDIEIETVRGWSREQLEAHARFLGLVLFRNKLKEDTADAIAELKGGDTRSVMITGDNALTGVFIARQCGMIGEGQRVLLGDVVAGGVGWRDVDNGEEVDVEEAIRDRRFKPVELAITGRAFEVLVGSGKMKEYLLDTRIFARMTPNDKVKCVQLHMERGITVSPRPLFCIRTYGRLLAHPPAMCGDGGNDCGALRAAHVGIALSEAEASIVSPFSTNIRSVQQCVELLRQGRSALATSFAGYKFLILYGETMAWFELLMFYFTVIAPQPIWIMIDGFITVCMTYAITQSQPAKVLGPRRPTARLLGPYTLFSTIGVIFINFWFVVCSIVWLFRQPWYLCNEFDGTAVDASKWWLIGDNYEAEVIALVVVFQFFNSAAIYNWGIIFRRAWWRNYLLVFFWAACFVSTSFLVLADPNPYSCIVGAIFKPLFYFCARTKHSKNYRDRSRIFTDSIRFSHPGPIFPILPVPHQLRHGLGPPRQARLSPSRLEDGRLQFAARA